MQKKHIVIISLLIISLLVISLYQTLATDILMNKTESQTADLSYTFDITDQTGRIVNVKAGATKILDIFLTNSNNGKISYGVSYTPSSVKTDDITIAQLSISKDKVNGLINKDEVKQISLIIINNSSSDITLTLVPIAGYENGGDLIVPSNHTLITETYEIEVPKDPLSVYIENLYVGSDDKTNFNDAGNGTKYERTTSKGLMKDTAGNIRYYGPNPNNYVKFNNELWRIVGIFKDIDDGTGKKETRVKIARNDSIGNNKWNTSASNEWTTSSLKNNLNGTYLQNLTGDAKNMIGDAVWNLGAWNTAQIYANQFYQYERGTKVFSGRSNKWTGKIALIYPSDYMYAGDLSKCNKTAYAWDSDTTNCRDQSWLKNTSKAQWTLQPNYNSGAIAFHINNTGCVRSTVNNVTTSYAIRPSLYLKAETLVTGGTGTSTDPYTLEVPPPATEYIESLLPSNLETMNNDDKDNNVRYMGADPNNYVKFNNELWRIIGVFNVKSSASGQPEKRLKIIKDEPLGKKAWDSGNKNDWTKASLRTYLNGEYYNSLTSESKELVGDTYWNIGGSSTFSNVTASMFYDRERGTTTYGDQPSTWIGKIGLMYPSDYGYATSGGTTTNRASCLAKELYNWDSSRYSDCKNNDYIYNFSLYHWTITSDSSYSSGVFYVDSSGNVDSIGATVSVYSVSPVLYLNSNVIITGGTGTSTEPYTLG